MLIMSLAGDSDNPRNTAAHLKHSVMWLLQLIWTLYHFIVSSYQLFPNYPMQRNSFKGPQFSTSKEVVCFSLEVHCLESALTPQIRRQSFLVISVDTWLLNRNQFVTNTILFKSTQLPQSGFTSKNGILIFEMATWHLSINPSFLMIVSDAVRQPTSWSLFVCHCSRYQTHLTAKAVQSVCLNSITATTVNRCVLLHKQSYCTSAKMRRSRSFRASQKLKIIQ